MSLAQSQIDGRTAVAKARVLIADDSVVARGLFTRWISEHPDLTVIGVAPDGVGAIVAAEKYRPDIIVLDLEMPILDGLEALPKLRKVSPDSRILVASCLTSRNAPLALECLALGATEVLAKPDSNRDLTMSTSFREGFLKALEALVEARNLPPARLNPNFTLADAAKRATSDSLAKAGTTASTDWRPDVTPRALLIGASTGGPKAITHILEGLGDAIENLPVIIVQHMPAQFTKSFADQLDARLRQPVQEASHGGAPQRGHVYIAPGGRHLRLERCDGQPQFWIDDGPPVNFCKPAIDLTFSDAGVVYGASALGVVLTGMGSDGTSGSQQLRDAGARILVQDEASSVVWGMPGSVVRQGLADQVLGIHQLGPALARIILGSSEP